MPELCARTPDAGHPLLRFRARRSLTGLVDVLFEDCAAGVMRAHPEPLDLPTLELAQAYAARLEVAFADYAAGRTLNLPTCLGWPVAWRLPVAGCARCPKAREVEHERG